MNKKPAYPVFGGPENGDPNYNPNNLANPYDWNVVDSSRGEAYFNAPASNSTMVSDNMEMARRLKAFVPRSSVKQGNIPINNSLGYEKSEENWDKEADYKSKYQ